MIYTDSRYATGKIVYSNDAKTSKNTITVYREFPSKQQRFFSYVWTSEDRIDAVAIQFFGIPGMWWKIMDVNPEIANPFSIQPGTVIRIPNA